MHIKAHKKDLFLFIISLVICSCVILFLIIPQVIAHQKNQRIELVREIVPDGFALHLISLHNEEGSQPEDENSLTVRKTDASSGKSVQGITVENEKYTVHTDGRIIICKNRQDQMICELTLSEDFQNAEVIFYTENCEPFEKHLLSLSEKEAVAYDTAGEEMFHYDLEKA